MKTTITYEVMADEEVILSNDGKIGLSYFKTIAKNHIVKNKEANVYCNRLVDGIVDDEPVMKYSKNNDTVILPTDRYKYDRFDHMKKLKFN